MCEWKTNHPATTEFGTYFRIAVTPTHTISMRIKWISVMRFQPTAYPPPNFRPLNHTRALKPFSNKPPQRRAAFFIQNLQRRPNDANDLATVSNECSWANKSHSHVERARALTPPHLIKSAQALGQHCVRQRGRLHICCHCKHALALTRKTVKSKRSHKLGSNANHAIQSASQPATQASEICVFRHPHQLARTQSHPNDPEPKPALAHTRVARRSTCERNKYGFNDLQPPVTLKNVDKFAQGVCPPSVRLLQHFHAVPGTFAGTYIRVRFAGAM